MMCWVMKWKHHDGDLCVFELYSPENGGSREGEIVLTQCVDKDADYDCHYTIKKYHSVWHYDEDGRKIHDRVELIPLNKNGYEPRELRIKNSSFPSYFRPRISRIIRIPCGFRVLR